MHVHQSQTDEVILSNNIYLVLVRLACQTSISVQIPYLLWKYDFDLLNL